MDLFDMYDAYIRGEKEIAEINGEFQASYVKELHKNTALHFYNTIIVCYSPSTFFFAAANSSSVSAPSA